MEVEAIDGGGKEGKLRSGHKINEKKLVITKKNGPRTYKTCPGYSYKLTESFLACTRFSWVQTRQKSQRRGNNKVAPLTKLTATYTS